MKKTNLIPFSLSPQRMERLHQLIMDVLSEVQYVRLIVAKRPEAEIVREVRFLLAKMEKETCQP